MGTTSMDPTAAKSSSACSTWVSETKGCIGHMNGKGEEKGETPEEGRPNTVGGRELVSVGDGTDSGQKSWTIKFHFSFSK